jgi:ubiquinone/menaquinone biosynthesis C-methylase UbiE
VTEADDERAELIQRWERGARGWGERADGVREFGMPVSAWMIDALSLQPGQRVLDLAAGPGDTGFMAAELIRPGGTLICSDGAEGMLDVARGRARELGIENVEFKQLELEWIDLETASVDAVLCRWGVMLILDPAAALHEMRRVLRPGGRVALAVWDRPDLNPWATIPTKAMLDLGHAEPPDPEAPGMFTLAKPGRLQELLENAGFQDANVEGVEVERVNADVASYIEETLDLARPFAEVYESLDEGARAALADAVAGGARRFTIEDGAVRMPGRTLVAAATA